MKTRFVEGEKWCLLNDCLTVEFKDITIHGKSQHGNILVTYHPEDFNAESRSIVIEHCLNTPWFNVIMESIYTLDKHMGRKHVDMEIANQCASAAFNLISTFDSVHVSPEHTLVDYAVWIETFDTYTFDKCQPLLLAVQDSAIREFTRALRSADFIASDLTSSIAIKKYKNFFNVIVYDNDYGEINSMGFYQTGHFYWRIVENVINIMKNDMAECGDKNEYFSVESYANVLSAVYDGSCSFGSKLSYNNLPTFIEIIVHDIYRESDPEGVEIFGKVISYSADMLGMFRVTHRKCIHDKIRTAIFKAVNPKSGGAFHNGKYYVGIRKFNVDTNEYDEGANTDIVVCNKSGELVKIDRATYCVSSANEHGIITELLEFDSYASANTYLFNTISSVHSILRTIDMMPESKRDETVSIITDYRSKTIFNVMVRAMHEYQYSEINLDVITDEDECNVRIL